jgi:tetratricopeptide (TPR) repeat protein
VVLRTIVPFVVAVAVAYATAGCSKNVTSNGSSGGGLSSMVPWGKPSLESQGISKYTYDQQQRSVVSPAMGLEDKSQPGTMARLAAAFSPAAVGKKVSAAFQRDDAGGNGAEKSTWEPGKKHKTTPEFYVSVARLAERAGNTAGATEQYEMALKVDPNHLDALLGYARMLDRQGQLSKATQLYVRATKGHPKEASAFNDLGLCYARQGMFNDSAAALSEAVDLQPDRELYRNNIATVLVELGHTDEAVSHLAAVHGEAIAHYNVGILLNNHGDTRGAAEQFAVAVQKNPNFVEARRWLDDLRGRNPTPPARQMAAAPAASPVSPKRPTRPDIEPGPGLHSIKAAQPSASARSATRPLPQRKQAERPQVERRQVADSRPSQPAVPQVRSTQQVLPPVSVPAWSLKADGVEGPAIPPTPEQVRQELTVDAGAANFDTPPAIRSLPPAGSAYYPNSRY